MTREEFWMHVQLYRRARKDSAKVAEHARAILAAFDALTAEVERLRGENARMEAASLDFAAEIKRLRARLDGGAPAKIHDRSPYVDYQRKVGEGR